MICTPLWDHFFFMQIGNFTRMRNKCYIKMSIQVSLTVSSKHGVSGMKIRWSSCSQRCSRLKGWWINDVFLQNDLGSYANYSSLIPCCQIMRWTLKLIFSDFWNALHIFRNKYKKTIYETGNTLQKQCCLLCRVHYKRLDFMSLTSQKKKEGQ